MRGTKAYLLLLLWAPMVSAQGIYKWVDADGQVHYGEAPPEGSKSSEVTVKTVPAAPPPPQDRQENTQRVLRAFEEERAQKEEQAAKEAKETEQRKRNCVIARDRLRRFQEAGGIYNLDANGERKVLNDAEHAATIKRAEDTVKQYCK